MFHLFSFDSLLYFWERTHQLTLVISHWLTECHCYLWLHLHRHFSLSTAYWSHFNYISILSVALLSTFPSHNVLFWESAAQSHRTHCLMCFHNKMFPVLYNWGEGFLGEKWNWHSIVSLQQKNIVLQTYQSAFSQKAWCRSFTNKRNPPSLSSHIENRQPDIPMQSGQSGHEWEWTVKQSSKSNHYFILKNIVTSKNKQYLHKTDRFLS